MVCALGPASVWRCRSMEPKRILIPSYPNEPPTRSSLGVVWAAFVVIGLLLMGVFGEIAYAAAVAAIALAVCVAGLMNRGARDAYPWMRGRVDWLDLAAVTGVYAVVVGLLSSRLLVSPRTTHPGCS